MFLSILQEIFSAFHTDHVRLHSKALARRNFLSLLILYLIGFPAIGQGDISGIPFIRNFTSQDYKGGIQNWSIAQDERDFVYVANNFGLLEYDGKKWNTYPVKDGTKVRSVYVGKDSLIYVGSQADFGYFTPDRQGNLTYVSLADTLPQQEKKFTEVWRIFGQGENIYFLTFENIYRYDGQNITTIVPPNPLEFSFFVKEKLYTQVWEKGLCELKNDSLHLLPGGDFFKNLRITAILPHYSGLLILTNSNGLYLYEDGQVRKFELKQKELLEKSLINTAILLKDGNIAIGTASNGLLIINENGELIKQISKNNGLGDRAVLHIYQDTQDHIWVALNNGIAMIELNSPFTVIDEKMGLPGAGYTSYKEGSRVLLGTNNGLFGYDPSSQQIAQIPNSTGQVYSICHINGDFLIGHHNGPMAFRNGSLYPVYEEKGAWLFKSIPGRSDFFVEGTYNGINLFRKTAGGFEFVKKLDNFNESSRVMEFDEEGNLWMAHGYKGIYKLQLADNLHHIAKIDFYNSKNGFPADNLINMERINNRLIFPAINGIYRYDKAQNTFVPDEEFSHLFHPDEHIVDMEQDIMGNIYFVSDQRTGVLQLNAQGKFELKADVFYKIHSLINDDLTSIHVLNPGNILFGAKEGFIHYNARKPNLLKPFKVHIRKVLNASARNSTLFGGSINKDTPQSLIPYKNNSLYFTYSATFFEDSEKTVFQYYLENFDNKWSEWTLATEKEYTNLPEGSFTFHVKARNIYRTESDSATFTFQISPPWYRTGWAYLLYSIALFSVLGFIFYRLDKRYKKAQQLIVLNKQKEILKKETEIKDLSNKTEQEIFRLKNEKLVAEIEHVNKELTSSTVHLISKNEQLGAVKDSLLQILDNKQETSKAEIRRIVSEIEKSISSDEDWHRFEKNFNLVHGDFIRRLLEIYPLLTPQEIKLAAYLRLNLHTKEIAQLMNISIRGVEISRYRLRKKLNLERDDNLTEFVLKF